MLSEPFRLMSHGAVSLMEAILRGAFQSKGLRVKFLGPH